jgi:hypothetical protein
VFEGVSPGIKLHCVTRLTLNMTYDTKHYNVYPSCVQKQIVIAQLA